MTADVDARRARAADVGMWLFLASLVMFFGSLYSGYVLLRAGSGGWPTPWVDEQYSRLSAGTVIAYLLGAVLISRHWRTSGLRVVTSYPWLLLVLPALPAFGIVSRWRRVASLLTANGHNPASSVAAASWFVLTGFVALCALAGGIAMTWFVWRHRGALNVPTTARQFERYWVTVLLFAVAVVLGLYVV